MNWADFSFVRPGWLLVLLPLGFLVWRLWRAPHASAAAWRSLIDAHLLAHLLVFPAARGRRISVALFAGASLAAVLALAGPALQQPQAQYRPDMTRVLVLDLSPGIAAQLEPVKLKLLALLQALPDGQTALLIYGDEPYVVVPPTTDVQTIARFVPDLALDAIPVAGNRPERALRMARQILVRSASQQREILWITAASEGADLSEVDLTGVHLSILQTSTAPDPALAAAASRGGGVLVRLRADDADIRELVSAWEARRSAMTATGTPRVAATELGYWLLLPLLPLAALAFRRGILALLLPLLLGALLTPQPAAAQGQSLTTHWSALWSDYQAWRLLEAGNSQAAASRFADPRWRAAAHYRAGEFEQAERLLAGRLDADAHYNRGNALARQGKLPEALLAYEAALALRPGDADTRANRDLVQSLLKPPPEPPQGAAGGAATPQGGAGQEPPPARTPPQNENQNSQSTGEQEANRIAEQWLRRVPDEPGTLLRRKLLADQRRRQSGEAARPW